MRVATKKLFGFKIRSQYILPMKIKILSIFMVLMITAIAGGYIEFFTARSNSGNIKIEWKTRSEANLNNFVIERKTLNTGFIQVSTVQAKGDNSYYYFIDENVYKSQGDLVFIYRLKLIDNDNTVSYSNEITVSHSVSSVKRTWGSIKAMFR